MDFQRTIVWVIFVFSLAVLWDRWEISQGKQAWFLPSLSAPASSAKSGPESQAPVASAASVPGAVTAAADVSGASVPGNAAAAVSAGAPVHIQTDLFDLDFDLQGAVLTRAVLRQEKETADWTAQGLAGFVTRAKPKEIKNIVIFDHSQNREYLAETGLFVPGSKTEVPNHRNARFELLPGGLSLSQGDKDLTVSFAAEVGSVRLVKRFTFHRGSYAIDVQHDITNLGGVAVTPSLYLQLTRDNGNVGDESSFYKTYTGPALYNDADHYHKVAFADIAKHDAFAAKSANNGWLAMVQHYFLSAWIPSGTVQRDFYTRAISDTLYTVGAILQVGEVAPGATVSQSSVLYVGPQDQGTLEKLAPGLDRVADYGWLDPIAKPLFWLLGYLYKILGNWGWAIVGLTILIKLAFYPLASAGFRSMARMKEVAPRIQSLKEKYGDDKQRMQMAMMELYKKEKINPVGGCLPILIPIPVFIALYWVLLGSVEMRNSPWVLWIHDLSSPDPWFILPAIMMVTSWVQFKLQPTPPDPVQAKMMMIMPLVFGVMFFFFPSGLVLYYVLNNGLSMLQQWRINQTVAKEKRHG